MELQGTGLVLTEDDVLRDADDKLKDEELALMPDDVLRDDDVILTDGDVVIPLEYVACAVGKEKRDPLAE